MPKRDRRDAIMRAAEKLFKTGRVHEITLDDVVREARVGKGTVYRYFADKDDLFFETATRGFDELCELVKRRGEPVGSFREHLLGVCECITTFFHTRHKLFHMMQGEEARVFWRQSGMRERWKERRTSLTEAIADVMREGVEQGEVRDDVPPETIALFLQGLLRTRAWTLHHSPETTVPLETVVDLYLNGAGAPGGRAAKQAR